MLKPQVCVPHIHLLTVHICIQKSLTESLVNPDILDSDFAKFGRPAVLHVGFQVRILYVDLSVADSLET